MGFGASDPRATHTIRAFAGLPGRAGFLQAGPPSARSLSARPANFSKAGNEASRVSSGDPNGCAQDLDAALQHQRRQKDAKPEPPAAASGSLCAGMLTPAGPVRECSVTDSQGAARVTEAERSPVEVVCVDFRVLRASCGVAEVPAPPCGCPDACQLFLFLERRVKEKRVGGDTETQDIGIPLAPTCASKRPPSMGVLPGTRQLLTYAPGASHSGKWLLAAVS